MLVLYKCNAFAYSQSPSLSFQRACVLAEAFSFFCEKKEKAFLTIGQGMEHILKIFMDTVVQFQFLFINPHKGGCNGNLVSTWQDFGKWHKKSLRPPLRLH